MHEADLREGFGRVHLPHALASKYPNADRESRYGDADVKTTMIYTHVLNRGGRRVVSPADLIRDT